MILNLLATDLYSVNLEPALAIPIVYFIAFIVSLLLRELTHGIVRYSLWLAFLGTFSALWYTLMLDTSPLQFILPAIIIFAGITGMSRFVGRLIKDIKKL